jgi:hypothetical protein
MFSSVCTDNSLPFCVGAEEAYAVGNKYWAARPDRPPILPVDRHRTTRGPRRGGGPHRGIHRQPPIDALAGGAG